MATQNNIVPAGQISFEISPTKHNLNKLLKKLDKNLDEAIVVVMDIIRDAEADPKTRLQAAQYLIDAKVKVSSEINKEILTRTIAQARQFTASQPKLSIKDVTEDDEDARPLAQFVPDIIKVVNATNL